MPLPPSTPDNDRDARRLLDSIPDAVLHVDAAGQVLVANTTANSLGRDGAPIVGQSVVHAFGQSFGASLLQLCRRVTVGTEAAAADLLHAETGVSWSARASPCDDGFCLILRRLGDSALPTANKRPTITERQLEALFDYAPVGFVYMDREGRYVRINQWMADMNGLPREEHIGRRIADVLPDIAPHAMPAITQIFETGKAPPPFEIHAETLYPSGAKRDFRVGWFPVTDMDGQVMYAGAVATEITELRRAEQESERLAIDLNRERRLLRAIIEQMPAGVIVAEAPDGNIILYNSQAERLLERPIALGEKLRDDSGYGGLHEDGTPFAPDEYPVVRPLITGKATPLMEMRYRRDDGHIKTFMVNAAPVFDAKGRMILSACAFYDITHRAEMESALRRAKDEAERADHAKSRFLAAASHDLRQPIQSLFFFAESLYPHLISEEGKTRLSRLTGALDALKGLLDSMLDISRLDANMVEPRLELFPLQSLLEDLQIAHEQRARAKGLSFRISNTTAWTRTDRTLLGRILRNLVENALRYTSEGEIVIECCSVPERGTVLIAVHDTGIGIPPEHMEHIWEEFHQVGNPERDREQGLGLGLAIVRRLSILLDLPVNVSSQAGKGSTFTVETPAEDAIPKSPTQDSAIDIPPSAAPSVCAPEDLMVLVIDDDAIVLMGTEVQLQDWGYQTIGATSGTNAVDALRNDGRCPDMILADYRLRAGERGTDAIQLIYRLCGRVPALILTGETSPDTQREISSAGYGLIHKPVTPAQLRRALNKAIAQCGGDQNARPSGGPASAPHTGSRQDKPGG